MTAIVWFRNDLRLQDNPALSKACENHDCIIPLYIKDLNTPFILGDAQKWWLHHSLSALQNDLQVHNLQLCLKSGDTLARINQLIKIHDVKQVYWNICYEPAHLQRDAIIQAELERNNIDCNQYNASLLIEPDLITNQQGNPYTIFTPFRNKCLEQIYVSDAYSIQKWPNSPDLNSEQLENWGLLSKNQERASGFAKHWQPGEKGAHETLELFINQSLHQYSKTRDEPAKNSTSKLSPYLHFGEISPHHVWRTVTLAKEELNCPEAAVNKFLAELNWRDFSYYLLYHFKKLPKKNYQKKFDDFPWQNDEGLLERWQKGMTGYPIVDAGMRELWSTGYMHNRIRMIVASFLIKDLLIDWRKGAHWFLNNLLDADLASNSLNWQWVAGCGPNASPYFVVFNPITQSEKFDPNGLYIKRWVPELKDMPKKWIHQPWQANDKKLSAKYPDRIVNHNDARKTALALFKNLNS